MAKRELTNFVCGVTYLGGKETRHAIEPDGEYTALCGLTCDYRRLSPFQTGHPMSCKQCEKQAFSERKGNG